MTRPAVAGDERDAEAIDARLHRCAGEACQPEAAFDGCLLAAAQRQSRAELCEPRLHEGRCTRDCQTDALASKGVLDAPLGLEVRGTAAHVLRRHRKEHKAADAGGARQAAEFGVAASECVEVGALAASRDDGVCRGHNGDHTVDCTGEARWITQVTADDARAGALHRRRISGRPNQRTDLLAAPAQVAQDPGADLAGRADDEDHERAGRRRNRFADRTATHNTARPTRLSVFAKEGINPTWRSTEPVSK